MMLLKLGAPVDCFAAPLAKRRWDVTSSGMTKLQNRIFEVWLIFARFETW
jgi:hypothetical protein